MKLSISNIAWSVEYDEELYAFLAEQNFDGIEIAPTRIFPKNPYDHIEEAALFAETLKNNYHLSIASIQSLWYGRTENIFASPEEKSFLLAYTKKAVSFAAAMGCRNLVFGSPKNRNMPAPDLINEAIDFFSDIGHFAMEHNTVIAFEPVPSYYGTNLINTTPEAFEFCRRINCPGFMVNFDLGTLIYNEEDFGFVEQNIDLVHHIHISEPMLSAVEERSIHGLLKSLDYNGYYSIEMKNQNDIQKVKKIAKYVKKIFV